MSRAFVKEQDGPETPIRPEPELPPGVPNRITALGAARFRARVTACKAERDGLGDADGGVASARRKALDDELRWLERRTAGFEVIPIPAAPDRVVFGATAVVSRGDTVRRVTVGGVDETDPDAGWVSFTSPVARALLGASPGDTVVVPTPRGDEEWDVDAVEPAG